MVAGNVALGQKHEYFCTQLILLIHGSHTSTALATCDTRKLHALAAAQAVAGSYTGIPTTGIILLPSPSQLQAAASILIGASKTTLS